MASTSELTSLNYTAPTCTLEVVGELSPLSQVAEKPLLKRLRFDLQIRDGAGSAVLEVRGMRSHLLALSHTVQTYIQQYLNGTHGQAVPAPDRSRAEGIALQPETLTRHTLHLGNLALPRTAQQIRLSTLQLADLADVLDQFDQSVEVIPMDTATAAPRIRRARSHRFAWVGTVAAVMLVAVGVSTVLPDILGRSRGPQSETTASAPAPDSSLEAPPATGQAPATIPPAFPPGTESAPPPAVSANPQMPTGSLPPAASLPPDGAAKNGPETSMVPQVPIQTAPSEISPDPSAASGGLGQAAPAPQASARTSENPAQEPAPTALATPTDPANATVGPLADSAAGAAAIIQPGSVDDLRASLQRQWVAPGDLSESLSYVLVIDPSGRLTSVVPQTDLASAYRDRISLPPLETQVLVPNSTQRSLRLTLFPSGTVTLE